MNEEWTWSPLGELFEIGAGKTMSAAARNGADKTPFLRTSNVLWDEIDLSSVDEMSIPEHELPAKLLREGDLLVCEGGEIGRAAIWGGEVEPMSFQNHVHRLRPIVEEVDPRFYVYFLLCGFTQLGIYEGAGNKTTIPNLSRSRLAGLDVPQPPLAEQQAISCVLSRVRDAIKVQDRGLATAQALKRAAMHTLFTRGLRGEAQKETEIGPVPESWEVVDCEDGVEEITVGVVVKPASYYVSDGIPAFRSLNIKEDRIDPSSLVFFSEHHNDTVLSKSKLRVGDLLVVRTGNPGTSCVVPEEFDGTNCIDLVIIRPKPNLIQGHFLSRFLNSDNGKSQALSNSHGLAQKHLNVSAVRRLNVPVPPTIDEQAEIVAVLDSIDRKIDLRRRKRGVLEELFKALLHKLMTGEIRAGELDLLALGAAV